MTHFFLKKPVQLPPEISSAASLGDNMLSAAVASSINAIAITDMDNKHIYVNSSWEKMWGYSLKEVIGMMISQMVAKEETARLKTEILPSIIGKGSWVGECWVLRKDRTKFLVSLSASLVKDDKGKSIGIVASFVAFSRTYLSEQFKA